MPDSLRASPAAVNALAFEFLYRRAWFRSLLGLKEPEANSGLRPLLVQAGVVAILLAAVGGGLLTVAVGTARILQLRRAAKKIHKAAKAAIESGVNES